MRSPGLEPTQLHLAEVAWSVPVAAAVSVLTWVVYLAGRRTAALAKQRLFPVTIGAGLLAGCSAAAYALVTDHSSAEVALSGQVTLPALATDPGAWSTGALLALLLCKGVAYALSIGVFRGGPVFRPSFSVPRSASWPARGCRASGCSPQWRSEWALGWR